MKNTLTKILLLGSVLVLAGCTVRSYPLTRDRVDQSLTEGNRGYIMGHPSTAAAPTLKSETRTVQIVEVELGLPSKVKKTKAAPEAQTLSSSPAIDEQTIQTETPVQEGRFEEYVVKKNDTLQKISKQFYGTTKNWMKIYNANKDTLKTPDRLYPGKTIRIPTEGMKTGKAPVEPPQENLK